MMSEEVFRRFDLEGTIGALAATISADFPDAVHDPEALGFLAGALAATFPALPVPDSVEACDTHPALIAKFRVPRFGRAAVKAVFVPSAHFLEVRVRLEVPGGSYRKASIERMLSHLERIEMALAGKEAAP